VKFVSKQDNAVDQGKNIPQTDDGFKHKATSKTPLVPRRKSDKTLRVYFFPHFSSLLPIFKQ
jgi:hypothetical protein